MENVHFECYPSSSSQSVGKVESKEVHKSLSSWSDPLLCSRLESVMYEDHIEAKF